ncbi:MULTISPECIES: GNAT family N-acetyltransferase [Bacillus cereus group]|uniref:GNAT family N-acetyltransferase n=1 Tax=Bacillus cereus group TaxID=86661 RepID=UPI000BEB635B|nr:MULTISPECIES: GNAT family N-acetyltransferase [Bacillus cereus group]MBJ7927716.1 GNAT family N-acetyltransferase [Bacillus cereus group sp. N31]PEG17958.1 GNAT family N-acetyltransferase [Bacillus toyonensis]PEK14055.1 GNAT family N-acetyltransferase [Bacillus toyonensis]PEM12179.1 GNAT family N-acetyltransferase [Bacillus toyonensis]PGA45754.1 GNAT family N-acetyltransferase [Bacillus toyonensis]
MNEKIHIIPYESAFQDEVVDLIVHIQQKEYNVPITKEEQPDLLEIETFYQRDYGNFWVATYGGKVVGTVALLDIENQQVALRKMFVKKEFRGKEWGASHKLLQTAISWAENKKLKDIYLGTTVKFLAAHRFYEKNNFKSVSIDELPKSFPVLQVDKKFYRYIV